MLLRSIVYGSIWEGRRLNKSKVDQISVGKAKTGDLGRLVYYIEHCANCLIINNWIIAAKSISQSTAQSHSATTAAIFWLFPLEQLQFLFRNRTNFALKMDRAFECSKTLRTPHQSEASFICVRTFELYESLRKFFSIKSIFRGKVARKDLR